MKLPKNYFENLSSAKYHEYLKLLPSLKNENTRIITSLILTFSAIAFFGILAINPTLTTIFNLKKQLKDSEIVNQKLQTKIIALSKLQEKYAQIEPDLPLVFDAIPKNPQPSNILSLAIGLAQKTKVKITAMSALQIPLSKIKNPKDESSFTFNLQVKGNYDNLSNFAKSLTKMSRVISIDSISINQDAQEKILIMDLLLQSYYKSDLGE